MGFSLDEGQTQYPQGWHGRSRLPGSGSGPGPDRRAANRLSRSFTPYGSNHQMRFKFNSGSMATGPTKLYVSNLDYEVTNEDLKILFSEMGQLKLHSIHYDRSGRSKGTAEVVYAQHSDAIEAMRRYNDCILDGKPLKIELVGAPIDATHIVLPPNGNSILGKPDTATKSVYGHGKEVCQRPCQVNFFRGVGGYGRSRGPERRMNQQGHYNLTAEELDAELERYHLEALEIK